jgi:hypothetical protein
VPCIVGEGLGENIAKFVHVQSPQLAAPSAGVVNPRMTVSHTLTADAREKKRESALCYSRQEKAWSKKNHLDRVSYRMVYIFP